MARPIAARKGSEVGLLVERAMVRTVAPKAKMPRAGCWCEFLQKSEITDRTPLRTKVHSLVVPCALYTCLRCNTPQTLDDHVIDEGGAVQDMVVCAGCGQAIALRLSKWKPLHKDLG